MISGLLGVREEDGTATGVICRRRVFVELAGGAFRNYRLAKASAGGCKFTDLRDFAGDSVGAVGVALRVFAKARAERVFPT